MRCGNQTKNGKKVRGVATINAHTHLNIGALTATDCPSKSSLIISDVPPLSKGSASRLRETWRDGRQGGKVSQRKGGKHGHSHRKRQRHDSDKMRGRDPDSKRGMHLRSLSLMHLATELLNLPLQSFARVLFSIMPCATCFNWACASSLSFLFANFGLGEGIL